MTFRTLDALDPTGKRVLMRADLNVPVRDGKITDLTRIERLSPTIRELSGKGANPPTQTVSVDAVPTDCMILDVGPKSVAALIARLPALKTLVWNGPLGAFETPPFDAATMALAKAVAEATARGALRSVAGGGDTVSALRQAGVIDKLSYVSSAGGAFLEWLEGKTLPGVAALG